jgi:hypothetical protein
MTPVAHLPAGVAPAAHLPAEVTPGLLRRLCQRTSADTFGILGPVACANSATVIQQSNCCMRLDTTFYKPSDVCVAYAASMHRFLMLHAIMVAALRNKPYCVFQAQPGSPVRCFVISQLQQSLSPYPTTNTLHCTAGVLCCAVLCCAVSRFVCRSELYEFDLTIDINIDIYPLKVRQPQTHLVDLSFWPRVKRPAGLSKCDAISIPPAADAPQSQLRAQQHKRVTASASAGHSAGCK